MSAALVVDIGNTRMKWGRCDQARVLEMCALPADLAQAWEKQVRAWSISPAQSWVVAGVHPARVETFGRWLSERNFPWRMAAKKQVPLVLKVDHPEQVGFDRLLNALAVTGRPEPSKPAIVVDAGSAVTVDYVDEQGAFCGGAILPGLRLMARALHDYTAQLPIVEIRRKLQFPETDTERAIELGIFHAVLGGVEALVRDLQARTQPPLRIFVGGGDGALLATQLAWPVTLWPEMTLEGIRQLALT